MRKESLDRILILLGPGDDASAIEYCKLHERISRFFEWNNISDPESLADEVIDRLGRRAIDSDPKEQIRNLGAFALGIARLLLLEELRRQEKQAETDRLWAEQRLSFPSHPETLDEALEHCLAKMPGERRSLIREYYSHERGNKVQQHQALADKMGITINALRNRALRARQDLEGCIRDFLQRKRS